MAIIQQNNENQPKISLPRRLAAYITSMNLGKVFRRHHAKESNSPISKPFDKSTFLHHQYVRPFSYHIPSTEQITPTSLLKPSNVIPYRIGISSDSTILNNGQTNENDEIVRLPTKNGRGQSPKMRRDRRHHSQLNANKRWLFRSMETLDGWKGKVFPQKQRTPNSSQTRSRSEENLADRHPDGNISVHPHRPMHKQQRAFSPNRSIEAITTRMINSIGIHRKSTNSIPNPTRTPALTIEKQIFNGKLNPNNRHGMNSSSAILDFREISSLGFSQSRRSSDDNGNNSLTPSDNLNNDIHLSDDDDEEEITSNLSFIGNDLKHQLDNDNEVSDSWDFSITWLDSLKEQHSPQRKIQFYENLIKLLEQDTLNIDELLVLRKVLSRIWPTDESTSTNIDSANSLPPVGSKINGTRSLRSPNSTSKQRSKLPTLTHHTAQRCSAILEPSPLIYEALNEQYSGQKNKPSAGLIAAKATPCLVETNTNLNEKSNQEQSYPQHLNPFDDDTDNAPSAPPCDESNPQNNESIRRYFERLTLLETIYEKLNLESNKKPVEAKENIHHPSPPYSTSRTDSNKTISSRFVEMNVDGNGSVSSGKSSIKRRAPKAPHLSQTNPPMFTLSSADVIIPPKIEQDIQIPIQITPLEEKVPKERNTFDATASCDDDGHIFVYDSTPNPQTINEEPTMILPRKTERIRQWLSTCERKEEEILISHPPSPKSQYKIRCTAKPIRHRSPSPDNNHSSPIKHELEPGRFRSCLKIHLETTEIPQQRSRVYSAASKYYDQQKIASYEDYHCTDDDISYQPDRQSVFL